MFKQLAVLLLFYLLPLNARAQDPARAAWIVNTQVGNNANLARVQPEVHSVTLTDTHVEVHSAGISLYYLGPFQTSATPTERIHQFRFRFPRHPTTPAPKTNFHTSLRPDVLGVFVNGLPIYNRFESASYQGQNLWHFDAIANSDDGTWTASGRPQAEQHGFAPGLLEKLIADSSRHSPIIGFAFDGYPIYGPWSYADADGKGGLRRMRSGYRLRQIKQRTHWPDGTALTPGQQGPAVDDQFPLGTFIEDYEYAAGTGDLDEFNGRFVKTPEYPNGTYAYFLTTDAIGRLAFPYLLARQYYGRISEEELNEAVRDGELRVTTNPLGKEIAAQSPPGQTRLTLNTEAMPTAERPARLSFQVVNACGIPIRFLEFVHERPLHLIVVSDDLAEFDHIHPELVAGDRYEVVHTFKHGGRYRLYADLTPPGSTQRIETFDLVIGGKPRASMPLMADTIFVNKAGTNQTAWTKQEAGLRFRLVSQQPLRAGEDIELAITVSDAATSKAITNLEPYLGAWAHFVIIDRQKQNFIHAHPLETDPTISQLTSAHTHGIQQSGPSPMEIRFLSGFPHPGLYKLWAQFQRDGQVIAQPFTLEVGAAQPSRAAAVEIPPNAIQPNAIRNDVIKITIGAGGFQPALLKANSAHPIKLAITRDTQPNCGNKIIFPALGITRELPLGKTVIIELPALAAGELRFTCGMGMYKGAIVVE